MRSAVTWVNYHCDNCGAADTVSIQQGEQWRVPGKWLVVGEKPSQARHYCPDCAGPETRGEAYDREMARWYQGVVISGKPMPPALLDWFSYKERQFRLNGNTMSSEGVVREYRLGYDPGKYENHRQLYRLRKERSREENPWPARKPAVKSLPDNIVTPGLAPIVMNDTPEIPGGFNSRPQSTSVPNSWSSLMLTLDQLIRNPKEGLFFVDPSKGEK